MIDFLAGLYTEDNIVEGTRTWRTLWELSHEEREYNIDTLERNLIEWFEPQSLFNKERCNEVRIEAIKRLERMKFDAVGQAIGFHCGEDVYEYMG